MAEIWRPEDFLTRASAPLAAQDFWDPAVRLTELLINSTTPIDGVRSYQIPGAQPPNLEDYVRSQPPAATIDPWGQIEAVLARTPLVQPYSGFDFWDPIPVAEIVPIERNHGDGWSALISLPTYDPAASENPFTRFFLEDTKETQPEKRARWLLSMLGVNGHRQYRFFLSSFTELFAEYPHHSTFRVLSEFALADLAVHDFISAFALRQVWNDFPLYSSLRNKRRELFIASDRSSLLGWKHAFDLISRSRGIPPEQIINPDWYDDWLNVPYADPLYWRFVDYIDARVDSVEAGALDKPPTTRRSVPPIKDISVDGFSVFNNFSRTSTLLRGHTDCWEYSYCAPIESEKSKDASIIDG